MDAGKLIAGSSKRRRGIYGALLIAVVCMIAPAQAAATGVLEGTVTDEISGDGIPGVCVFTTPASVSNFQVTFTDADGEYSFPSLAAASDYRVAFNQQLPGCPAPVGSHAGEAYNNKPDAFAGDNVAVTDGNTTTIDAALAPGATISGTVTNAATSAAVPGVCVGVFPANNGSFPSQFTSTNGSGQYSINVAAGDYKIGFAPSGPGCSGPTTLASEFYNDARNFGSATVVEVDSGQQRTGIDAALEAGATISGTVTDADSNPVSGVCVRAHDAESESNFHAQTTTDADGDYTIPSLAATGYKIQFCGNPQLAREYYDDRRNFASADTITLTTGESRTGVDAVLDRAGTISGTVTDGSGAPVVNGFVNVSDAVSGASVAFAPTDGVGNYTATGVPPGEYKVSFAPPSGPPGPGSLLPETYNDKPNPASGTVIPVAADQDVVGIDAQLTASPTVAVTSGPTGSTNNARPTFNWASNDSGAASECSITSGPAEFQPCPNFNTHQPASDLADGSYTFRIRVTNGSGSDVDTRSFTVDTAAPTLSISGGPTGPTNAQRPTFEFNAEPGSSVECSISAGAASFGPCSAASSHQPASNLADGAYTFSVKATDGVGNTATSTRSFTVDTAAPTLSISGGPEGGTTDHRPTFSFAAEAGSTVECSIDTGTASFGSCSGASSHQPATDLADGAYTFRVRATDSAGNQSDQTRAFTVTTQGTTPTDTNPTDTNPTDTNPTGTNPTGTNPTGTNPTDDAACDQAKQGLKKAKAKLKKAKESGNKTKIKKAKDKVKKAKAKVKAAC